MFELIARSTIAITDLEIDVRWDFITKTSVAVDVYVFHGGNYEVAANDASQWERIAQTTAVRRGGDSNSAVLQDMTPIQVDSGRRIALYIALRNEPIAVLDYTAYALDKTGEVAETNSDMQLLVGLGFVQGQSFATPPDTVLDPQFAGVLHYSKPIRCAVLSSKTVAQYVFLLEQADSIAKLNSALAVAVANACEKLFDSYPMLRQWEEDFVLQQSNSVPEVTIMAYAYDCPDDWSVCPSHVQQFDVEFLHEDGLESRKLLRYLYDATAIATIQNSIRDLLEDAGTPGKLQYLGQSTTEVLFHATLRHGDGWNQMPMNDLQRLYFVDTMAEFLADSARSKGVDVFEVELGRAARRLASSSQLRWLQTEGKGEDLVVGKIHGSAPIGVEESYFGQSMELSFASEPFIVMIQAESSDTLHYFQTLQSAEFQVVVTDTTVGGVEPTSTESNTILTIIGVIFGGALVLGCLFFARFKVLEAKEATRRAEYRETTKQERLRRAIKHDADSEETRSVKHTLSASTVVSVTSLDGAPSPRQKLPRSASDDGLGGFLSKTGSKDQKSDVSSLGSPRRLARSKSAQVSSGADDDASVKSADRSTSKSSLKLNGTKSSPRRRIARSKSDDGLGGFLASATDGKPQTDAASVGSRTNRTSTSTKKNSTPKKPDQPSKTSPRRKIGRSRSDDGLGGLLAEASATKSDATSSVGSRSSARAKLSSSGPVADNDKSRRNPSRSISDASALGSFLNSKAPGLGTANPTNDCDSSVARSVRSARSLPASGGLKPPERSSSPSRSVATTDTAAILKASRRQPQSKKIDGPPRAPGRAQSSAAKLASMASLELGDVAPMKLPTRTQSPIEPKRTMFRNKKDPGPKRVAPTRSISSSAATAQTVSVLITKKATTTADKQTKAGKDTAPRKPPSRSQSATVAGNSTSELALLRGHLAKAASTTKGKGENTGVPTKPRETGEPKRGVVQRSKSAGISVGSMVPNHEKPGTSKKGSAAKQQGVPSNNKDSQRPATSTPMRGAGLQRSVSASIASQAPVSMLAKGGALQEAPVPKQKSDSTSKLQHPPQTTEPRRGGLSRSTSGIISTASTAPSQEKGDPSKERPALKQQGACLSNARPPPQTREPRRGGLLRSASAHLSTLESKEDGGTSTNESAPTAKETSLDLRPPPQTREPRRGGLLRSASARIDVVAAPKPQDSVATKTPTDGTSTTTLQKQGAPRRGALRRSASERVIGGPVSLPLATTGQLKGDAHGQSARSTTDSKPDDAKSKAESSRQPGRGGLQRSVSSAKVDAAEVTSFAKLVQDRTDTAKAADTCLSEKKREPRRGALQRSTSDHVLGGAPPAIPSSASDLSKSNHSDKKREGRIERRGGLAKSSSTRHLDRGTPDRPASKKAPNSSDDAPQPGRRGGLSRSVSSRDF